MEHLKPLEDQMKENTDDALKNSSRFDYVEYDAGAVRLQEYMKAKVQELEAAIQDIACDARPKAVAITKLEECYMWIGKAIRDAQLKLNEERKGKA